MKKCILPCVPAYLIYETTYIRVICIYPPVHTKSNAAFDPRQLQRVRWNVDGGAT
jgi:hypothetical protein